MKITELELREFVSQLFTATLDLEAPVSCSHCHARSSDIPCPLCYRPLTQSWFALNPRTLNERGWTDAQRLIRFTISSRQEEAILVLRHAVERSLRELLKQKDLIDDGHGSPEPRSNASPKPKDISSQDSDHTDSGGPGPRT